MKNCACLACGSSNVEIQSESTQFEYKGETTLIPHNFICCNDCGSETDTDVQSKESKRLVLAFKKKVDGLLSGPEIIAIRDKYKINQHEAAKIFGGGKVAFSKYENDDVSQSESMNNLLIIARDMPKVFVALARKAGVDVKPIERSLVPRRLRAQGFRPRTRSHKAGTAIMTSISPWQPINSWDSKSEKPLHPESGSPLVPVMDSVDTMAFSYCES